MSGCTCANCFITPAGLDLLQHGCAAPLWRHVVTPANCPWINLVCFAILLLCVGYGARKVCARARFAPFFAMAAFAVVPQFAEKVTRLTPFLFAWVPIALSAALVASLNAPFTLPADPVAPVGDSRCYVRARLLLAGALAAVGAWESTYGLLAAPFLLAITWFACIRRGRRVLEVSEVWFVGFFDAFLAEPILLSDCTWSALMPQRMQILGVLLFVLVAVMPLAVIRWCGERLWMLGGWTLVILTAATITFRNPTRFATESASERFVRHVLADIGTRKFIIGDGIFDVMIDAFKPADVKRIDTRSIAEREFLINLFDNGEPVTNTVVLVNRYYGFAEMSAAVAEACVVLPRPAVSKSLKKITEEEWTEIAKRAAAASEELRIPLVESLEAMKHLNDIPEDQRKAKVERARQYIRKAWMHGFRGLNLSTTLLTLDVLCGDRVAAESDAITALTIDRNDPAANAMLGGIRLQMGQYDKAERYLLKGVKGGGAGAYNDLAMLFLKTGRASEAEAWVRKAVAKVPNDWNVRETLVQVLIACGRTAEATKELDLVEKLAEEQGQLERARPAITRDRKRVGAKAVLRGNPAR